MITVSELAKTFKGDLRAVDGISFQVSEGEFFGFLGPNGAGKTTTMRILATLDRPTSGGVVIDGIDVVRQPAEIRKKIGFAMQAVGLDDMSTARENLMLMGGLHGMGKEEAKKRCDELLTLFGLQESSHRFVSTYSGGMRRRLDVAVALMHHPKVLFLDEPTEGLDPAGRRIIWQYLKDLNDSGMTIFLTTHYMEEADFLVQNLAIINKGKIVAIGTPSELKAQVGESKLLLNTDKPTEAHELVCQVFPGIACSEEEKTLSVDLTDGPSQAQKVFELFSKNGISVSDFEIRSPSLEDVFIKFTGAHFEDESPRINDPYFSMNRRS